MDDYTSDQLGPIITRPIGAHTKDRYGLIVIQPRSNVQVTVIEPCSWSAGRKRVDEMVRAGIDPADIRFVYRAPGQRDTDGLPLRPCEDALWYPLINRRSGR